MEKVLVGTYIREQRVAQGLTQEKLCGGICSSATLSRLENNQQTPTWNRVNALLQRLGLPSGRYFALLSGYEMEIDVLQKEIRDDCILFRRSAEADRPRVRQETLEKLEELEKLAEPDDTLIRQFILGKKASLGGLDGPYRYDERMELLMEAIQLTVPDFNLKKIYLHRYTIEETKLINQIANTYADMGEKKKAISIYSQLLSYIEEYERQLPDFSRCFCLVAHNYAIELTQEKRYNEAAEIAERGWELAVKSGRYQHLPGFIAILAECRYFMGDKEESVRLYRRAYYIYDTLGDVANLELIRLEMKERLELDLSD